MWEFDKRLAWGGQNAPSPRKMELIPLPPAYNPNVPLRLQDLNLAIDALDDKQIPQGIR